MRCSPYQARLSHPMEVDFIGVLRSTSLLSLIMYITGPFKLCFSVSAAAMGGGRADRPRPPLPADRLVLVLSWAL